MFKRWFERFLEKEGIVHARSYTEGHDIGMQAGYDAGFKEGRRLGHSEGLEEGKAIGRQRGPGGRFASKVSVPDSDGAL